MYVKVFEDILDSSIWDEDLATRIVWLTMLIMAGPDGIVRASQSGIRRRAGVNAEQAEHALDVLTSPDADSKDPEHEGRRVERVDRGWLVLNYLKYREIRTQQQLRDAERPRSDSNGYVYYLAHLDRVKIGYSKNPWARCNELQTAAPDAQLIALERGPRELERQRHREFAGLHIDREWFKAEQPLTEFIATLHYEATTVATVATVDRSSEQYASASVSASKRKKKETKSSPEFDAFRAVYPKRAGGQGWQRAQELFADNVQEGVNAQVMIQAASDYAAVMRRLGREGTDKVKMAQTFLGPGRHWEEEYNVADIPLDDDARARVAREAAEI